MKRYHYNRTTTQHALGCNIKARRKAFDLYFRFKPDDIFWPPDSIVVARIGFDKRRIGNGGSLLKFLINQSKEFDLRHVAIEQTHTDAGKGFAVKYGFQSRDNQKNWSISIESLSKKINFFPIE